METPNEILERFSNRAFYNRAELLEIVNAISELVPVEGFSAILDAKETLGFHRDAGD